MNSEFENSKKISLSKDVFFIKGIYVLTERPRTGTCYVAAIRRPSLSLVFNKEKRDKQSI